MNATGDMSGNFNYRFSSEYLDVETGLAYYNHRYYTPELGRWLSRDPIGELGNSQYSFNIIELGYETIILIDEFVQDNRNINIVLKYELIALKQNIVNIILSSYNPYMFCSNKSINSIDRLGLLPDDPINIGEKDYKIFIIDRITQALSKTGTTGKLIDALNKLRKGVLTEAEKKKIDEQIAQIKKDAELFRKNPDTAGCQDLCMQVAKLVDKVSACMWSEACTALCLTLSRKEGW